MRLARILSSLVLAFLTAALGGCVATATHPPLLAAASRAENSVSLLIRPAYQVQGISHRWVASDVHHYEVTLRVWNGAGYQDLEPSLTVIVPQKGTEAKSKAVFTRLKQGLQYQATVLAKGNVGGTAPELTLNAFAPTEVPFSFSTTQNVEATLSREVAVTLDPAPFSGRFILQPTDPPAGTDGYEVQLDNATTGQPLYTATYASTQTMVLRNLRVGTPYIIRLTALSGATALAQASSEPLVFDPAGQDLEQDRTVALVF